jgi:hypothetical protein
VIWGQVVEGDEIKSVKTGRWYAVSSTSTTATEARIRLVGVAKLLTRPVGDEVPADIHRRGPTGAAVDLFVVAFSGPNLSVDVPDRAVGPTLSERTEDE